MNAKIISLLGCDDIGEVESLLQEVRRESQTLAYDQIPWYHGDDESIFQEVLKRLRERYNCKPPSVERYEVILRAAETATNWKLSSERTMVDTIIRCFVSYRMRQEGYTFYEIAHLMQRDHSSVVYHVKRMSNMLSVPGAFKKEMAMWEVFERILADD